MSVLYRAFCAFVGAYLARHRGMRDMWYAATEEWVIGVDDLNGERATFTGMHDEWTRIQTEE